jgi:hypothetical protein
LVLRGDVLRQALPIIERIGDATAQRGRGLMAPKEKCVHQSYRKGGRPKFTQPATQARGTSAEQELGARPQGSGSIFQYC